MREFVPLDEAAKNYLETISKKTESDEAFRSRHKARKVLLDSIGCCVADGRVVKVPYSKDDLNIHASGVSLRTITHRGETFYVACTENGSIEKEDDVVALISLKGIVKTMLRDETAEGLCINPWDNGGIFLYRRDIENEIKIYERPCFQYDEITPSTFFEMLSFAKQNMCLKWGCTTCGNMPFRDMCKKRIGVEEIKKMINAITVESAEKAAENDISIWPAFSIMQLDMEGLSIPLEIQEAMESYGHKKTA